MVAVALSSLDGLEKQALVRRLREHYEDEEWSSDDSSQDSGGTPSEESVEVGEVGDNELKDSRDGMA